MEVRYFQYMYEVELYKLDEKGKYFKKVESFFSENLHECQQIYESYHKQQLPTQLNKVYVEVDEDGMIIDVEEVLDIIDKTF